MTGQHGELTHFGNVLANAGDPPAKLASLRRPNVDSVAQFFDAKSYATDKSDV